MRQEEYIAQASTAVHGSSDEVWEALTNPSKISKYMMGTDVESSWKTGSKITWKGDWKGKKFEDHGEVLDALPGKYLRYTHITGEAVQSDATNQHIVTVELEEQGDETMVTLTQDNNADEKAKKESEKNWITMLGELKKVVEESHAS